MDLQHIPKTFWHALSISVLILSTGFVFIAYKSNSVSIELANTKIELASEINSSKLALKSALEETKNAKKRIESVLDKKKIRDNVTDEFKKIDENIEKVENSIQKLNDLKKLKEL